MASGSVSVRTRRSEKSNSASLIEERRGSPVSRTSSRVSSASSLRASLAWLKPSTRLVRPRGPLPEDVLEGTLTSDALAQVLNGSLDLLDHPRVLAPASEDVSKHLDGTTQFESPLGVLAGGFVEVDRLSIEATGRSEQPPRAVAQL